MKIEELLTRYFDGNTTCSEERKLKQFFKEEYVPPELEIYRPLFAFFEEETKLRSADAGKRKTIQVKGSKVIKPERYFVYTLRSIIAGLLIISAIVTVKQINQPANYAIIDGHKSTDIRLVREQAKAAFDDVGFSREDIFETLFNE